MTLNAIKDAIEHLEGHRLRLRETIWNWRCGTGRNTGQG
jgi:hypothetical protein